MWRHARRDAGSRRGSEWAVSHSRSILSADTADTLSSAALTSAKSHLYFRCDQCALHCSRLTYPIRGMFLVMSPLCSGLPTTTGSCCTMCDVFLQGLYQGIIFWGNGVNADPGTVRKLKLDSLRPRGGGVTCLYGEDHRGVWNVPKGKGRIGDLPRKLLKISAQNSEFWGYF